MPRGLMAMGCNSQGLQRRGLHSSLASAWCWHSGQVPFRLQHRGWVVLNSTSSVGPPIGPSLDSKLQTRPPPAALGSSTPPRLLRPRHSWLPTHACPVRGCSYTTCATSAELTHGATPVIVVGWPALQEVWQ